MDLGAFSISLNVADLEESRTFYERLGFDVVGGTAAENWLILANGTTVIGLFHGMFEKNMLTFNPGWASDQSVVDPFTDVRDIQRKLQAEGVELASTVPDDDPAGPASMVVIDPDGNPILIDQHR